MVMPCSRSAFRPSVSREKSTYPLAARFTRLCFTAASWSSYTLLVSCSSRPISVDLPSSTLPAVVKRSISCPRCASRNSSNERVGLTSSRPCIAGGFILEVSLPLLHFHRAFFVVVDHTVLAFAAPEGDQFLDDLRQRVRLAAHRARAWRAAQRPHAHLDLFHLLARKQLHAFMHRSEEHTSELQSLRHLV